MTDIKAPPIPRRFTKRRKVRHWGSDHDVKPAVAHDFLGDGRVLLWFQPLNTRPDYYLIRVDSKWAREVEDDGEKYDQECDDITEVIDALTDEFGEKDHEREYLADDLRAQGIEPTAANTDLDGNEDRLGWPVLDLDAGYTCGVVAVYDGKRWV